MTTVKFHLLGVEIILGWPPVIVIRTYGLRDDGRWFRLACGYRGCAFERGRFWENEEA
jgi:hypothetical protein